MKIVKKNQIDFDKLYLFLKKINTNNSNPLYFNCAYFSDHDLFELIKSNPKIELAETGWSKFSIDRHCYIIYQKNDSIKLSSLLRRWFVSNDIEILSIDDLQNKINKI